jgi:tetratricopeptide (TPR) repeat protein
VLTTTLHRVLESADAAFEAGRTPAARAAYEDLLERAQGRTDRPMEVIARAMLARCHLRRKDPDAAREQLDLARQRLDAGHVASVGRWRASRARLAIFAEEGLAEVRAYLDWAEERQVWSDAIDACELLAATNGPDRAVWLQRAVDLGVEHEVEAPLGRVHAALAGAFEQEDRLDEALDAWQQALAWYQKCGGTTRQIVGAAWAVGVLAIRTDDWPLAQRSLERATVLAEATDDCGDLLALALSEVARIHEASGDVIEARRVLLRSLAVARTHDLPRLWPERWNEIQLQARALEII